ncbi:MAG: DUF2079 domain-containing protein [Desulfobulbales bacterium]|nr:DUF2079 domain-containing protein [Desulfobulbales bacterium]
MKSVVIRSSILVKSLKVVMFCHFGLFCAMGMSRHWGYLTSINDLGVFDQVVWNTLNGAFSQTTINPVGAAMNWLGFHFQPVLLLFVPLYRLHAGVEWFIAAQAAALALAAWPIFLLAEHLLKSEKAGIAWALVYLFNPFLLSAGKWDFHPITLAVPFIATAFLGVVKKNGKLLFWSSLAILLCKEHLGLMIVGFGILWWIRHRTWKTAAVISGLGFIHLFMVLGVAMPYFSPIGKPVMLGEGLGQLSRYGWLGGSPPEILQTFLTRPGFVWQRVLDMGGHIYWFLLIIPFSVVLPLVGFSFLLPGLADLAANTLSANPMPRSIWAYHSAGVVPVLTAAAIGGAARLSRLQGRFSAKEFRGFPWRLPWFAAIFPCRSPLRALSTSGNRSIILTGRIRGCGRCVRCWIKIFPFRPRPISAPNSADGVIYSYIPGVSARPMVSCCAWTARPPILTICRLIRRVFPKKINPTGWTGTCRWIAPNISLP